MSTPLLASEVKDNSFVFRTDRIEDEAESQGGDISALTVDLFETQTKKKLSETQAIKKEMLTNGVNMLFMQKERVTTVDYTETLFVGTTTTGMTEIGNTDKNTSSSTSVVVSLSSYFSIFYICAIILVVGVALWISMRLHEKETRDERN